MAETKKPLLFFTAFPGEGHTNPLLKVAHEMVNRGYDVVFHTSKNFKDRIEAMGAGFAEAPGIFDLVNPENLIIVKMMPQGMARVAYSIKNLFLSTIPARTENLEEALAGVRERTGPSRQIIILTELCSVGVMPFKWGRPAPRGFGSSGDQGTGTFPRTIGLSAAQLSVRSIDTGPYMLNLPPDSTESGRLRNAMLSRLLDEGLMRPSLEYNAEMMHKAGAATFPKNGADLMSTWFTTPDVTLQMCLAEQEYPLSDLNPKIKFVGCLPRREPRPDDPLPDWWPEILANTNAGPETRKKVVFVSQGTVALDYTDLVIPTLKAFADRADEVLVVVALGVRGATLPEDAGQVPSNARIADYLHYDTILGHADVMVSNAGYGALCHAVVNGVPLVLAGESEDKTESTNRATWAGYALGLYTQKPAPQQIRSGVETVLANEKYRQRALELKALNEAQNTMDKIEGWIKEFTV